MNKIRIDLYIQKTWDYIIRESGWKNPDFWHKTDLYSTVLHHPIWIRKWLDQIDLTKIRDAQDYVDYHREIPLKKSGKSSNVKIIISFGFSFDVNNEDWISTISEAFEGFSDFKKLKKWSGKPRSPNPNWKMCNFIV